jgi:death on curing protein
VKDPRWLTREEIRLLHRRQVELFGGVYGVIDENVVDSALHRRQQLNHYVPDSDVSDLTAAYLLGFAQKQGFTDGNKRIALASALTFLRLNGYELHVPKEELLAFVLSIAKNEIDQDGAAKWFRTRITEWHA